MVTWDAVISANGYELEITPQGGNPITYPSIEVNSMELADLLPCKLHTMNLLTLCGSTPYPSITTSFHTAGCENCADISYCTVSASASGEFIQQVTLGDINRTSTSDGGYIFVTDATTTLHAQSNYNITVTPGYPGASIYNENFRAWIDYNSDGDFDDTSEMIFDADVPATAAITGNFTVPSDILNGSVRLRVGMRYTTGSTPVEPLNCGEWSYGETEDYCITLDETVGIYNNIGPEVLTLYPNPTGDMLNISKPQGKSFVPFNISILSIDGKLVLFEKNYSRNQLDVSSLHPGVYSLLISEGENIYVEKFIKK